MKKHYRNWPDFLHKTVKGPIELSSDYSYKRVKFNEVSLCNFKAFASFRGGGLLQEKYTYFFFCIQLSDVSLLRKNKTYDIVLSLS